MSREETRRENARRLASKIGGKTEFGRFVGMEPSQVSQLIGPKPTKNIGNSIARRIEQAFDLPAEYLDAEHPGMGPVSNLTDQPIDPPSMPFVGNASRVTVDGEDEDEMVPIKKVSLRLQAGFPGFEADREFDDGGTVNLPRKWIEKHDLVPQCLLAIKVRGNSMEPMLFEDDIVVINIADTKMVTNELYAINFNGQAVIKQLVREDNEWWLYSFNRAPEFSRVLCRGGECIMIGKIVHQGARSLIGKL